MKTIAAALVLAVSLCGVASADEASLPPLVMAPTTTPALSFEPTPEWRLAHRKTIAGSTLLGVAAASFAASVALGLSSFVLDFCGYDTAGAGCDRTFRTADRLQGAAIGMGVLSGASLLVGIPLTVSGKHGERTEKWKLGATPTEGGMSVMLSGRF